MTSGVALHRFSLFTVVAGFFLVIAGGLVTSTGSGLAVPDWPLSYGTLFPPMVGGILYEHSHRLIAAAVGLLTLSLALWVLFTEQRRWVRRLALAAFGMVVLQGILGGLTVLLMLPPAVSILHACLGQTFFATLAVLARVLSPSWKSGTIAHLSDQAPELGRLSWTATLFIYSQLVLGAAMRHAGWVMPLLAAHLIGAAAVITLSAQTAQNVQKKYAGRSFFTRPAQWMRGLVWAQIALGAWTLLFQGKPVWTTTAHVAAGAGLLAVSAVLSVSLFYFVARVQPMDGMNRPLKIYLELTKPRLTFLAGVTALLGFLLGGGGSLLLRGLALLAGTALVGAGAGALNQYLEVAEDGRMERTKRRPLPSGRLDPDSALKFGVAASAAGILVLALGANLLAGSLAAATLAVYLFLYTPLKRRSALCTLVGAIPGALPPLIGWAAAQGRLGTEAWLLFSILFLWQLPHFLAIAWTWREDYARAGFQMLPVLDPEGGSTARQIVLYCLALIPVSLMPAAFGSSGLVYFSVALACGISFLAFGLAAARARSCASARRLFFASIIYLPLLLTTLTLDRMIFS